MGTETAVLGNVRTGVRPLHREHLPPPGTAVAVRLLGDFEVRVGVRTLSSRDWPRRHSAALVKLLALVPGRSLHREQVLDALWPDLDIGQAGPRLHKAAHFARKTLGHRDAVVLGAETVRLYPGVEVHIDATAFEQAAEAALRDGDVAAAKAALALHNGVLLPHDLYEPWAEQHRAHLGRLYTELLHQAEDWHQALAADASDETAHLALARRYAESGDRAAALRQLDRLDEVMRRDLGLAPGRQAAALRHQLTAEPPGSTSSGNALCCGQASRSREPTGCGAGDRR